MTRNLLVFILSASSALVLSGWKDGHSTVAGQASAPPVYVTQGQDIPTPPPLPAAYGSGAATPYAGYALAERARAFDQAVGRRRPDYAFRYQSQRSLAWRTADDYSMYAEPNGGGYRDYYYAPRAEHPYFVRDRDYGYGYGPDGRLAAVYDAAGGILPSDPLGQIARSAADYYLRALTLRRYGLDDDYRAPLSQSEWAQISPAFDAAEQPWRDAPDRQPQWREWRRSHVVAETPDAEEWRHDNGRHFGWYKHGHKGFRGNEREDGFAVAYAGPGNLASESNGHGRWKNQHGQGRDRDDDYGDDEGDGHGHGHGHGHGKKD